MSGEGNDHALRDALRRLGASLREEFASEAMACGPYRLLKLIGEGGVAEVFAAARDDDDVIRFAVKIVKPGADGHEVIARFARERAILATLEHPGIVRTLESGVTGDGRPWFAMPLVDGSPLTIAADLAGLDLDARLGLFRRLLEAIAAAHAVGVVHRDLKPGNILAESIGGEYRPRVIDFGVARAVGGTGPGLTPSGHAHRLGTPDYMPPEQWDLGIAACDSRSDVFSLGVILGELAAGTLPRTHRENTAEASTARSRSRRRRKPGAILPPSSALRSLAERETPVATEIARRRGVRGPDELVDLIVARVDPIFMRATAAEPSARFADAAGFAAAMRSHDLKD